MQGTRKKELWTHAFRSMAIIFIFTASICSACGGKFMDTTTIHFRCDSSFNDGLILPVDLVYVTEGQTVEAVTEVSPDEWFDSESRAGWETKQSLSLKASETRKTVTVDLEKPENTIALVVIADYQNIGNEKSQSITFDAENAEDEEDVFVTINGLLH